MARPVIRWLDDADPDRTLIAESGLFDAAFYLDREEDVASAQIDALDHYVSCGGLEGRRPGPAFDGAWYLAQHPDVAAARLNPLVHYLRLGRAEGRRPLKRFVVYSAVTGNFDDVRPPAQPDPHLDYVVFTDEWLPRVPAPWVRLPVPRTFDGPRLTARWLKVHPHLALPMYDVSAWVDAAFQIDAFRAVDMEALLGPNDIACFTHPERNCAYAEAEAVRRLRLESDESVDRVVARLRAEGMPPESGLFASGVVLRRHASTDVANAMDDWWQYIEHGSIRDQLSINHVIRRRGLRCAVITESIWSNPWMHWVSHRPPPWRGLQCGGAYLDAEEYEAIERAVGEHGIRTVLEMGAGETSRLFAMLGLAGTSIEATDGPWVRRATAAGCRVAMVPFDEEARRFSRPGWRLALADQPSPTDLLFIDSPIGTERRAGLLAQVLEDVDVRFVLYHDVWRDAINVLRDVKRFDLRLESLWETPRGLALFSRPDAGARAGDRPR